MEKQPFYQSQGAESSKGNKEGSRPGGFNIIPPPSAFERPAPRRAEPRPVERLPLEGVIDWRRTDEEIRHHSGDEKAQGSHDSSKAEEDGEGQDSEKSTTSTKAKTTPAQSPQPVVEQQHRSIADIVAEGQQAKEPVAAEGEVLRVEEGEHSVVAPGLTRDYDPDHAQTVHQPIPRFNPLEGFPPVAQRSTQYPTAEQSMPQSDVEEAGVLAAPATEAYAAPTSQPEQIWQNSSGGNTVDVPLQTMAPQSYAAQQAPNVRPAPVNLYPGNIQSPTAANMSGNLPPVLPGGSATGAGGNFNQQPPVQPGFNYNLMSPYNPNNPAMGNAGYNANATPMTPNTAPVMPIERPGSPTYNRDPRVGPVAALLGLEYLARKRADRKLERRVNERADDRARKQEQQRAVDHRIMQERQRQLSTEQQRQADELRRTRSANEYTSGAGVPRPFEAGPSGTEQTPIGQAAGQPLEARPFAPLAGPGEHLTINRQEMRQAPTAENPEAQSSEMENPVNQPNRRVEHSAWHNIVVDEHGHEVAGAIQYGEGFQRERQQEAIRDRVADGVQAGGGGGMGASTAASGQNSYANPAQPGTLPSGMISAALPPGPATHADVDHQLQPTNGQRPNFTNPWFWLMLLLTIAAFFTAALV